uniref:Glycosyltransferase family 9 protein n=1 Tax=candidate division WOR-3 bacterium TaxID=2052148 RepID=A0A7C4Y4M6_UNCW3
MRILFRAPNWVGDAVLSTSILKELLNEYEDVFIGLREYVSPVFEGFNKEMLFLGKNPFDNGKIIEKYRFDISFIFTPSFSSALETFIGKSKERIGFPTDKRHLLLTKRIKTDKEHLIDQYRDIVKDYVELNYFNPEIPGIKKRYKKEKYAGIDMKSAFGPSREWKIEGFKKIAYFLEGIGFKVIQVGKEYQVSLTEKTINLTGKTTLKELIEIISEISLFISVDTGSMHIAGALGIPQVAFYLSTSPEWTAPFYNRDFLLIRADAKCSPCFKRTCKYKDYHCRDIDIEIVLKKIGGFIEKSGCLR